MPESDGEKRPEPLVQRNGCLVIGAGIFEAGVLNLEELQPLELPMGSMVLAGREQRIGAHQIFRG
jgi:hypothetical protein